MSPMFIAATGFSANEYNRLSIKFTERNRFEIDLSRNSTTASFKQTDKETLFICIDQRFLCR